MIPRCIPTLWSAIVALLALAGARPAAAQTWAFSHVKHVGENGMECATCHTGVAASTNLKEGLAVTGAACRDCHDTIPAQARSFKLIDPSFKITARGRPGFVAISHAQHLKQGMECKTCHGELIMDTKKQCEKPRMADCAGCHHHQPAPTLACLPCHDRPEKPTDHASASWIKSRGHGAESRFAEERCQLCHTPGSCLECHQGAASRPVHNLNYRFTHGLDVKSNRMDCTVCHETPRFCADCHEGKGR